MPQKLSHQHEPRGRTGKRDGIDLKREPGSDITAEAGRVYAKAFAQFEK